MRQSKQQYQKEVNAIVPRSPVGKNAALAFLVGGAICALGQLFQNGFAALGLSKTDAGTMTAISLVALSALATGLSLYDDLAKHAGAGTLVPITGFANAIAAPAIEYRTEGIVPGTCVKMFTIAGPVLAMGLSASVLYGVILWLWTVFF